MYDPWARTDRPDTSAASACRTARSWDPLGNRGPVPLMIRNPIMHLDYAKAVVVAARYYDVPASAVEKAARDQRRELP